MKVGYEVVWREGGDVGVDVWVDEEEEGQMCRYIYPSARDWLTDQAMTTTQTTNWSKISV